MAEVRHRRAAPAASPFPVDRPPHTTTHTRRNVVAASTRRCRGAGYPRAWTRLPSEFSEDRARVVLEQIMSFGYRPVGTKANEELTPNYLLEQIEEIRAAKPEGVSVDVDVQRPSGAFGLDFIAQFQNIYANVTNILVKAAHGFITQHPWTDTIRAFINLEAAGAGGRELLFQTGSDELALAYAQGAKYPHASIIAQELFQSGIIPADTDYRIYRDFGYVAGMDFAYIANGYVYHTSLDDVSRIQPGAVQRLGENIVGVVDQLGSEPGRLKSVAENRRPLERSSRMSWVSRWCFGAAYAASLTVGVLLSLYAPLPWYSQPYLAGPLFLAPALAGMVHQLASVLEKRADRVTPQALWRLEESLFEAMMCIWMGALAICMQLGLISSYVLAVWIFFPLMGQVLCQLLQRFRMFSSSITDVLYPVAGSKRSSGASDIVLSLLMCIILLCFASCNEATQADSGRLHHHYRGCNGVCFDSRLMLQHVHREVVLPNGDVQTDSGLWINSLDFRGPDPIKSHLSSTQWKDARMQVAPEELHEHAEVYGHMPWSLPVKHMLPEDKSWYLPAAAPALPSDAHKAKLEVLSSTGTVPSSYHFWIEAESNKPIDVAFVGHFLEVTTPEMKEFTNVLPSWTVVASASVHLDQDADLEAFCPA
ncbi:Peptidase M28 [Phytophthora cactorum]|nr:Peptidase M28 [Phytophthora cactorum]